MRHQELEEQTVSSFCSFFKWQGEMACLDTDGTDPANG